MIKMPGKSYSGPFEPLDEEEVYLRDRLKAHVAALGGRIGERNVWRYRELEAAADYIRDRFAEYGYRAEEQVFNSGGKMVRNIAIELQGEEAPAEIIVVGAHYDSVRGSPGANDNGTGVSAILELPRLLKDEPLDRTVRFVAFVNEEPPFFYSKEMGSHVYAVRSREREERIVAMLSLETIGYYSDAPNSQRYPFPFNLFYPDTANFIGFVSNLSSRKLLHRSVDAFRRTTPFPSAGVAAPFWITGIGWSDHLSFWQAGYDAIMVTDTALFRYVHYHASTDTPDKIDYTRTARVVKGLSHVVMALANER
jgi:Zn-dependent M28 family amino/carboxypeptidase